VELVEPLFERGRAALVGVTPRRPVSGGVEEARGAVRNDEEKQQELEYLEDALLLVVVMDRNYGARRSGVPNNA
jgi:hypothetical protein